MGKIYLKVNAGLNEAGREMVRDAPADNIGNFLPKELDGRGILRKYVLLPRRIAKENLQERRTGYLILSPNVEILIYFLCLIVKGRPLRQTLWSEGEMAAKIKEVQDDFERIRAIEGWG